METIELPSHLPQQIKLGDEQRDQGQFEAALSLYSKYLEERPNDALPHYKIGTVLLRLRRHTEAESCFRKALALDPEYIDATNNLCVVLMEKKEYAEAEPMLRRGLSQQIDHFNMHLNLGDLLVNTGRQIEGVYYLRRARELRPDSARAMERLARPLIDLQRVSEAKALLESSLAIDPSLAAGWVNLGRCHLFRGDIHSAEECNRIATQQDPKLTAAWMNLLLASNYSNRPHAEVFDLHCDVASRLLQWTAEMRYTEFPNTPVRDRRLRIGFVSGDLRRHSVSYFVEGPISKLDNELYEAWAYFNYRTEDYRSEELKPLFHKWRNIFGIDDRNVAEQIRQDGIDILVDLNGYTGNNRMTLFALQPAPIQVSWIGYANTTGMQTISYRISDDYTDPPIISDAFASEELIRIAGCFLSYTPPRESPQPKHREPRSPGHVRFGSFNTRTKIGPETLALWGEVMRHVPHSTLLIKSGVGLNDEIGRNELRESLRKAGLPLDRIEIRGFSDQVASHLSMYDDVDICLDTIPYNGTTTTCEALWMGVPVVVLAGDRHAGRVGVSLLANSGLVELIAEDAVEYVRIARELANDPKRLLYLHSTLRHRIEKSALLDHDGMASKLQKEFRRMWTRYCDRGHAPDVADVSAAHSATDSVANATGGLRLNVGGTRRREGWKILNALPGPEVDFVGDIRDLSSFPDESYIEVYASHVLEHIDQNQIVAALKGLRRILAPAGRLYISVPDLSILSHQFVNPRLDTPDRMQLMRMMFGGQVDPYDYHSIGLTLEFMIDYLSQAGFYSVEQVESLGLFEDTSDLKFYGTPISLNLVAIK